MFTAYRHGYPLPIIGETRTRTGATWLGWGFDIERETSEWERIDTVTVASPSDTGPKSLSVALARKPLSYRGTVDKGTCTESPSRPGAASPTSSWR